MHSFSYLSLFSAVSLLNFVTALPVQKRSPVPDQQYSTWSPQPTAQATPSPSTSTSNPAITSSSANPVLPKNFPDPSFLETNDGFYAFATSGNGANIQIAHSPSFDNPTWTHLNQDALPNPGAWTDGSANVWAPYVFQAGNGNYVLYYAAPPSSNHSTHCIGAATSKSILGPYTPSSSPIVCPISQGGAIDPSVFKDPTTSKLYLLYKIDGNNYNSSPTPIKLLEISPVDGITPLQSTSSAQTLIDKDANDGPLVEAPAMFFSDGTYYLLFSTHLYNTLNYDLRYATAPSITGPWTQQDSPALSTGMKGLVSPGSADVDPQGGNILFHATVGFDAQGSPIRYMYGGSVTGKGGKVVFDGFANAQ